MKPEEIRDDPVDEVVRRFLAAEEAKVDSDAFLDRLQRRGARRRVVHLVGRWAMLAAAAMVAVATCALFVHQPSVRPPARDGLMALQSLGQTLRTELTVAFHGALDAGTTAVAVGREPVDDLAAVKISVPGFSDLLSLGTDAGIAPEPSKEDE